MITYKLQPRIFKILKGSSELTFPNELIIDVEYGPPEPFGASNNPSRLGVRGSDINFLYNANTGRVLAQSKPHLPPLFARIERDGVFIELKGTNLHLQTKCKDIVELENILLTCLHGYPPLLNLEFPDPPIMLSLTGRLGDTEFRWEFEESIFQCRIKSKRELESHIITSLTNLPNLPMEFLAACTYFYTASRLMISGYSCWEFMAESILNFCKALQVIFGETMDDVRSGIKQFGYSPEVIEIVFIPLMVLRNYFDVGHAQSIVPQSDQLQVLYRYLMKSEDNIRDLLKLIFDQIIDGKFKIIGKNNLDFDPDKQKKFDQIIDTIKVEVDRQSLSPTIAPDKKLEVRFSSSSH